MPTSPDPDRTTPPALPEPATDEQTLSDIDQTLADTDQTGSDGDQVASDRDQMAADADGWAADQDQQSSDRDLSAGADPVVHARTRDARRRAAVERERTAQARLETAALRDQIAAARDVSARARDLAAQARDQLMALRDDEAAGDQGRALTGAEVVLRAGEQRRRAGRHRAQAAEHRVMAARDREAAAADREQAARDRQQACADREALANQLALAETDTLTGARTRAAGLSDLEHELERCRRTGSRLVVAYVDVIGLKQVNDTLGHAAGDEVLKEAVIVMREHLRPYDLIVRLGGDEFVCAMSAMTEVEARERFDQVAAVLTDAHRSSGIRAGFGELLPDESVAHLIARADAQLLESRPAKRGTS